MQHDSAALPISEVFLLSGWGSGAQWSYLVSGELSTPCSTLCTLYCVVADSMDVVVRTHANSSSPSWSLQAESWWWPAACDSGLNAFATMNETYTSMCSGMPLGTVTVTCRAPDASGWSSAGSSQSYLSMGTYQACRNFTSGNTATEIGVSLAGNANAGTNSASSEDVLF